MYRFDHCAFIYKAGESLFRENISISSTAYEISNAGVARHPMIGKELSLFLKERDVA
jgi:hypothetical protein